MCTFFFLRILLQFPETKFTVKKKNKARRVQRFGPLVQTHTHRRCCYVFLMRTLWFVSHDPFSCWVHDLCSLRVGGGLKKGKRSMMGRLTVCRRRKKRNLFCLLAPKKFLYFCFNLSGTGGRSVYEPMYEWSHALLTPQGMFPSDKRSSSNNQLHDILSSTRDSAFWGQFRISLVSQVCPPPTGMQSTC